MRRKEERKANSSGGGLENMMAYVDENGQIVDTPPDPAKKVEVDASEIELHPQTGGRGYRSSAQRPGGFLRHRQGLRLYQ